MQSVEIKAFSFGFEPNEVLFAGDFLNFKIPAPKPKSNGTYSQSGKLEPTTRSAVYKSDVGSKTHHFLFGKTGTDNFEFAPQTPDTRDLAGSWFYAQKERMEHVFGQWEDHWEFRSSEPKKPALDQPSTIKPNGRTFDRRAIMVRAWDIYRSASESGSFNRPKFSAALRLAWFEAKRAKDKRSSPDSQNRSSMCFQQRLVFAI